MKRILIALLLAATCAHAAHAEIYTWTDKKGTSHYTNSIYDIPEKYRARAKVLDLGIKEKNDNATGQQSGVAQPVAPAPIIQQGVQAQPAAPPPPATQIRERPKRDQLGRRVRSGTSSEE